MAKSGPKWPVCLSRDISLQNSVDGGTVCKLTKIIKIIWLDATHWVRFIDLGAVHMRWAGPAMWAGSARWGDFHPSFIWNFLSHCKKLVVSLWKDSFDHVAFKREILYFQYGIQKAATISFYCIQYYEYDHCFVYSLVTSWDFTYIRFTYIRFYLPGGTRRSHFEIEFGKNSKTYSCALKKNLSHLAGLTHLHMFIWQIFISPR